MGKATKPKEEQVQGEEKKKSKLDIALEKLEKDYKK